MTFLNITLLAGTVMVALPVVLHLIMRRKPKQFEFPALRLVQKRHDSNQRRLRLRHILLLLLRAGAIALLAFALARPSVNLGGSYGSQEAPVAAALVFDTAPRMQYRQDNATRLDAAKRLALRLLAQLPRESQIAVIDTRLGPASFQVDRGAAQQRIQQLETTPNAQPLPAAIEEALRVLGESDLARKEIYVFSDMAASAWPAAAAAALRARFAALPAAGAYVIDVGAERPVNVALGELRLSSQILTSRSALRIAAEVHRAADATAAAGQRDAGAPSLAKAAEDRAAPSNAAPPLNAAAFHAPPQAVELYLLDAARQPQKQAQSSVALEPGASQPVEFTVGSLPTGVRQGFVRLVGQDGLEADDVRYFTVEVRAPWKLLLVTSRTPGTSEVFAEQALSPEGMRKRGEASFDCEVITQGALADRDLRQYAAVLLLDPAPLEPLAWRRLADYVAEGHGLGIFLGRNLRPVELFNIPEAQELLPAPVLRQARRPDGDVYLAPRSYEHPIFRPFRDFSGSVPWQSFPVFRYWELDPPARGASVVLRLNDDSPVIFERAVGAGRVLTMATPVSDLPDDAAWNLLPVGDVWQPFVILMYEIGSYLVGGSDEQFNYLSGQPVTLKLSPDDASRSWVLIAPGDLSLPLTPDASRSSLTVTTTDQPGNYRVAAGEGRNLGFSVNLAPRQTELARIEGDEMDRFFVPGRYRLARNEAEIDRNVNLGRVGRELYPLLIVLVGMLLALEHVVANRFYRE